MKGRNILLSTVAAATIMMGCVSARPAPQTSAPTPAASLVEVLHDIEGEVASREVNPLSFREKGPIQVLTSKEALRAYNGVFGGDVWAIYDKYCGDLDFDCTGNIIGLYINDKAVVLSTNADFFKTPEEQRRLEYRLEDARHGRRKYARDAFEGPKVAPGQVPRKVYLH